MCAKRKAKPRLLDFSKSFYTDLEMEGMLHAVFVRSPIETGMIKSITHPELPQGCFLITAQDIPGEKNVNVLKTSIPVFAHERVSYRGEPIGMLVGPDKNQLDRLLNGVVIRFKQMDFDIPSASEQTGMQEDDVISSDKILAHKIVSGGQNAEMVFAESDIQVEGNYSSLIDSKVCSEPVGGIAVWNQDTLSLYSPVQWFSQVRSAISQVLGIGTHQIEIKKTLSAGGNSSNIWYSAVVMAQLALATKICGKPVKLVFSREEQRLYAERGVPVLVSHRTAVNPDGKIKAMIVSIVLDAGYYNPFVYEIIDRLVITSVGIYSADSYKIEAYVVRSSNPPASVNLSRIDSQVFFAVEKQMQRICTRVNLLPHEARLLNCDPKKSAPFCFNLYTIDQIINTVVKASDFSRKYACYKLDGLARLESSSLSFSIPIRGVGLASAFEGSGFVGSDYYASSLSMKVTMEKDGTVVIHSYPPSASIRSIWLRLVSSMLDIPMENIKIDSDFDIASEPKYPNGFFGSIGVMTQLLKKCCTAIQRQRFRHPLPISVSRGITPQQKKQWDSNSFSGTPFFATASGAMVVEVELDPCTFRINIRGIWIAIDAGKIVAPRQAMATVKAQVRLLLSSLLEDDNISYDKMEIQFIKSSDEPKQVGELVYNLLPVAFACAVEQAFSRQIESIPISPQLISQPVTKESMIAEKNVQEVVP